LIFNRKRKDTEKYSSPLEINACLLIFDINYTLRFLKYESMLIFEKLSMRKYLLWISTKDNGWVIKHGT
jgi:hypothetical protein